MPGVAMCALVDRAAIIGGGIGGLATAIALRKVGINATVYERSLLADRMTAAGTLVSIFGNGLQALHAMDPAIPMKLKEKGSMVKRTVVHSPTGEVISDTSSGYTSTGLMIQWSRILETFEEFLPPSCIQSGYTCTGVTEVDDEVEVFLTKDGEATTVKAPIVIGADGIRSTLRDYVLEDKSIGARDLGKRIWRAIIPTPKTLDPSLDIASRIAFAAGRTAVFVKMSTEQLYWTVIVEDAHGGAERSTSSEEMIARIKAYFPDWDILQTAIDATDVESILERKIVDLPDIPRWSRGRLLLIGDAAHAMAPQLGQGANLAIEDGLELARQLKSASTLQEAFSKFVEERQPRVKVIRVLNDRGMQQKDPADVILAYKRLLEPL
eukprot:TRINITY_DN3591_c1_g1_i1.p1 TRINITY_DN3591_c1_g1~~TRINITY_DN3591_c1_g1_i1.p1  ORF type:complete len:381 (-),score=52.77 TRINITY_DN3591_c1_g1_i1:319-1461(-)